VRRDRRVRGKPKGGCDDLKDTIREIEENIEQQAGKTSQRFQQALEHQGDSALPGAGGGELT
jgi:hypothetical protein